MTTCYFVYKLTVAVVICVLLLTGQFFGTIAVSFVVFMLAIAIGNSIHRNDNEQKFLFCSKAVIYWYMTALILLILQNL